MVLTYRQKKGKRSSVVLLLEESQMKCVIHQGEQSRARTLNTGRKSVIRRRLQNTGGYEFITLSEDSEFAELAWCFNQRRENEENLKHQ